MTNKDRIEAAIRHIQTAVDIDPWAQELAVEALKAQSATDTNVGSKDGDIISRQAAIDALESTRWYHINDGELVLGANSKLEPPLYKAEDVYKVIKTVSSTQPEDTFKRKLMMYLADLQLTYSPGWESNGQGDAELYEFVTGLIEEIERWGEQDG